MHLPANAVPLPFPVHFEPFVVGRFRASRSKLRDVLGDPHYVETDESRTPGGQEDSWAWQLESNHRVLIVLHVPYDDVSVYCDPPSASVALAALGVGPEEEPERFDERYRMQ